MRSQIAGARLPPGPRARRPASRRPAQDLAGLQRWRNTDRDPRDGATSSADAVLDYVWALPRGESDFTTVIVPEIFERPSLTTAIRRRSTFALKLRLLSEPGVVVTDVPVVLDAGATPGARA